MVDGHDISRTAKVMNVPAGVVLATGAGNPPAVRFLPSGSVRLGSVPSQTPEQLCLEGFVTRTDPKHCVIWHGWNRTAGPFSGSYNFGSN